jgi:Beta-galactosidase
MPVRRTIMPAILLAGLFLAVPTAEGRLPKRFFGISPQTVLSTTDTSRMKRGGIDSVRVPVPWSLVEPSAGGRDWSAVDHVVGVTARRRLELLPFLYSTPSWVARKYTTLPVGSSRQRRAWAGFLRAFVGRYGPRGDFWRLNPNVPKVPIRRYQIWNEENYFYFATPASPRRYAALVKLSHRVLTRSDRRAQVLLGGLFGQPRPRPPRGMDATRFLRRLYRVRGIKRRFDGVALHPYEPSLSGFKRSVAALRRVMIRNGDRRTGLYLTEFGWGSQGRSKVSFEVGRRGQVRMVRRVYRYMRRSQRRLNLKRAYWFSWKDVRGECNFCDSVGFFRAGSGLRAKPAWRAFVRVTGGRP